MYLGTASKICWVRQSENHQDKYTYAHLMCKCDLSVCLEDIRLHSCISGQADKAVSRNQLCLARLSPESGRKRSSFSSCLPLRTLPKNRWKKHLWLSLQNWWLAVLAVLCHTVNTRTVWKCKELLLTNFRRLQTQLSPPKLPEATRLYCATSYSRFPESKAQTPLQAASYFLW